MRTTPTSPATANEITYFLGEGPARCELCLGSFSYEFEVLCVTCERAMCPFCALRIRLRGHHCPDCGARPKTEQAGEAGEDRS